MPSFPCSVHALPDVVLVLDVEKLRVEDVNRGDEGAFGFTRVELLAQDAFALFPRWWDAEKTLLGTTVATYVKLEDGSEAPVDLRLARTRCEDGTERIVVVVREGRSLTEVERELAEVNTYLHAIVENIPDMIFVKDAATHAFRRFNRAGEELLGFTRGELLGKTDHDFYPKEQADFFHEKDVQTFRDGAIVDIAAEPIETRDRGERILHTRKIPIYDEKGEPLYLLGISEDITERVKAEQTARELADVVRCLGDAVVTTRPDGTIASFNPAAERLWAISSGDAIGASFESIRARTEHELDIETTTFPIHDADGQVVRIATIARDLTEVARLRRATQVLSGSTPSVLPPPPGAEVVGAKMREAMHTADLVARDDSATVLLLGETGVGKSWMARRIHQASPRSGGPFFEVNCAGLARELVESELFGHERGAFTGAAALKRGLVEMAEGGTLFLDEVGELPQAVQAQLLTFLDTRRFRRVGGTRLLEANVRIVAATNVELRQAVEDGRFRRDLYYRLSVVPILIPALRERSDEIASLANEVLAEIARRTGRRGVRIERRAVVALERYAWPGNIRELRNALERALILSRGEDVEEHHLSSEIVAHATVASPSVGGSLDDLEREAILRALDDAGGNRTRAAERLGISRATMKRKLAQMRASNVHVISPGASSAARCA